MYPREMQTMTLEQRVSLTVETLRHGRKEFGKIQNWMVDDGGEVYPDQLAMTFAVRLLLERIEESTQNRLNGKEDSASVERATQVLMDVLDDPVIRGEEPPEGESQP